MPKGKDNITLVCHVEAIRRYGNYEQIVMKTGKSARLVIENARKSDLNFFNDKDKIEVVITALSPTLSTVKKP